MAIDNDSPLRPPQDTPAGLELLNRGVIEAHLETISELDRHALLDVLVPHRYLPEFDPAAYVIKAHDESNATPEGVALRTSYDLGVAFGRSLMVKAAGRAGAVLPIIDEEVDISKRQYVDEYLQKARLTRFKRLVRRDQEMHPDIERAAKLFAQWCEMVIPDKMLDGDEELKRGLHDYLSVIDILETSGPMRDKIRRRLGGTLLLGAAVVSFGWAGRSTREELPG